MSAGPFRPMKGASVTDPAQLSYPRLCSPKLDGIRALVTARGELLTGKLKPVPNVRLQRLWGRLAFAGYDGELIAGAATASTVFNHTQSVVMSREHPDTDSVVFWAFDHFLRPELDYVERRLLLRENLEARVRLVPDQWARSAAELSRFHAAYVDRGYEGTMTRLGAGPYKYGRSTLREQYLLKWKPFEDAEGWLVGVEEARENRNPAERSELGLQKRSSAKAGRVPKGTAGTLLVETAEWGCVRVGPGNLTAEERITLWEDWRADPARHHRRQLTFQFQRVGTDAAPRLPTFRRWRHPRT